MFQFCLYIPTSAMFKLEIGKRDFPMHDFSSLFYSGLEYVLRGLVFQN